MGMDIKSAITGLGELDLCGTGLYSQMGSQCRYQINPLEFETS